MNAIIWIGIIFVLLLGIDILLNNGRMARDVERAASNAIIRLVE